MSTYTLQTQWRQDALTWLIQALAAERWADRCESEGNSFGILAAQGIATRAHASANRILRRLKLFEAEEVRKRALRILEANPNTLDVRELMKTEGGP
jgi:hypothetical protein